MAIISRFFSCFPGTDKVVDEGNDKNVPLRKAPNIHGDHEAKGKSRKNAPILVALMHVVQVMMGLIITTVV